jgi:hypothetical protein
MTVKLSDYQEGLLREIRHFVDTIFADQVRAEFVARNNAEAQLAEARRRIVARQDIIADLLASVGEERRRAELEQTRLEAVKGKRDEIVREAVRVSAEYLRTTHWDGNGCGTNGTSGCSRCYGPSPADADEVAEYVLDVAWPVIAAALSVAPQPEPDPIGKPCTIAPCVGGLVYDRNEAGTRCWHEGGIWHDIEAPQPEPAAKCEHSYTKPHPWSRYDHMQGGRVDLPDCPGPVSGGAS